jgi:hypothetical protein
MASARHMPCITVKEGVVSTGRLANAVWRKSSRSNGNGGNNCVEVAFVDGGVGVRDSRDPTGPALLFTPDQWAAFLEAAKHGDLDLSS